MSLFNFINDFNMVNKLIIDKENRGFSIKESIKEIINEELLKEGISIKNIDSMDVEFYNSVIKSNLILSFLHAINFNKSDDNNYLILKYNTRYSKYYINSKYARSLVVNRDVDNVKIISYGFEKFYNLGEKGITSDDVDFKINENGSGYMVDKLDGVNITVRGLDNDILINTTGSLTKVIQFYKGEEQVNPIIEAEKYLLNSINDFKMVNENKDIAFIYEMIGVHKIVVNYNDSFNGLHLIGGRKFLDEKGLNSRMLTQEEIQNLAEKYNVRYVKSTKIKSMREVLDLVNSNSYKGKEGVVVYVGEDIYKVKCDDYVLVHHLKMKKELKTNDDLKQFLKLLTPLIINDSLDDYIGIFKGKIPLNILELCNEIEKELDYFNIKVLNIISNLSEVSDSEFFKSLGSLNLPNEYKNLAGAIRKNLKYNTKLSNIIIEKVFKNIKTN